jgi:hypothetical protein
MSNPFNSANAMYGLELGEFEHLPVDTKKKLVRLIARIAEKAYRRGLQQGVVFTKSGALRVSPGAWRFETNLDKAPRGEDGFVPKCCGTSIERLFVEVPLEAVGLRQSYVQSKVDPSIIQPHELRQVLKHAIEDDMRGDL